MKIIYLLRGIVLLFCGLLNGWVGAQEALSPLEQPTGRIILTITGKITRTNSADGKEACFDRDMLEKLPQKTIKTTTRWTEGVQSFEGVLLGELLRYVGATGTTIEAVALDNYISPPTPINEFEQYSVILALKKEGKYIRVRDKGPTWIIYPIDDYPELRKDLLTQYKLIWHLRMLIVK